MNKPQTLPASLPADFDLASAEWMLLRGGSEFDYPIDYAYAVASADPAKGRIELLVRWEPDAYCHYHRHLGTTTATVLAGEQHIIEERPHETVHKLRKAGFQGPVADGDVHMEHAGPEGLTMLFSVHAPDGRLFDLLDGDGNTLLEVTIADVVERRLGEPAAA
ncbi:MAG: hypothetical protein RLW61_15920 [Gammaproteobacteria bacterium]